jgi:hypothetical protein
VEGKQELLRCTDQTELIIYHLRSCSQSSVPIFTTECRVWLLWPPFLDCARSISFRLLETMEVFTDKFLKREILSPIESLVVITHLILFFITIPLDSVAFPLFCAQKIFPSSAVLTFANAIFSYVAILFTIAAVTSSVLINVMSENIIRRHVKTNAPQNSEVNASTTPLQQSKDSAKLLYEYKRLESGQIRSLSFFWQTKRSLYHVFFITSI